MLDDQLNVTYANPAAETLFAQARSHLVGAPFGRALPGNEEFGERLHLSVRTETGFNATDLLLEAEGYPVHVHCVATPVEPPGPGRRVLESRDLHQQLKIDPEAKHQE